MAQPNEKDHTTPAQGRDGGSQYGRPPSPAELNATLGTEELIAPSTYPPVAEPYESQYNVVAGGQADPFELPRGEEPTSGFDAFNLTLSKPPTLAPDDSSFISPFEPYIPPKSSAHQKKRKAEQEKLRRWNLRSG